MRRAVVLGAALLSACVACSNSGSTRPSTHAVRLKLDVPRFVDVTASAGLDVVQATRRRRPRCLLGGPAFQQRFPSVTPPAPGHESDDACIPERMSGGVAVGDFDGDGWPDVYLTRLDGPGVLYRNQRDGHNYSDINCSGDIPARRRESTAGGYCR